MVVVGGFVAEVVSDIAVVVVAVVVAVGFASCICHNLPAVHPSNPGAVHLDIVLQIQPAEHYWHFVQYSASFASVDFVQLTGHTHDRIHACVHDHIHVHDCTRAPG